SKNTEENARDGLRHPDSVLHEDDFVFIRANWDPKSENVLAIADDLNVLPESVVFADDNPAEREIVTSRVAGVSAPPLDNPEHYIRMLDRGAFFEVTNLSEDDVKRTDMYRENVQRRTAETGFADYHDYLLSLRMEAVIAPFDALLYERISQLTNKSNQFNLTTKRFTVDEIAQAAGDETRITLYGKLKDRFGDNGVVSLVVGRIGHDLPDALTESNGAEGTADGAFSPVCHIELWLMSCRVLKRDMEYAMMDALAAACEARGVKTVFGYYYPTAKNGMVTDFYAQQGFACVNAGTQSSDGRAETVWKLDLTKGYRKRNDVIRVITESVKKENES
ncbi:MAG: HAD family hydrolase, partial [Lachnospiraceae bacterium]|nr:HAD family hydrolase [Lachnospiraceae bacterium]